MRVAVIADVHGNLIAREAVLAHLRGAAPDLIVNLSDLVSAPSIPPAAPTRRWRSTGGAGEDHVLHLRPAARAGVAPAHDPAQRVHDVALAAAVRPDEAG